MSPAAAFCHSCGTQLAVSAGPARTSIAPAPGPAPTLQTRAAVEPERRQATIMFCDLAGSTTLSTTLDPEDLRTVLRSYQSAACAVVSQHEGYVSAYLGDGILVLFGYPHAHEDDPERAVRAGLEIAAAVRELHVLPDVPLGVRIGIATGLTVVGDLIGEGASREEAVVGRTPNLAARLQSLARPGHVVISLATRKLVGHLFDYEDLGEHNLKGFQEPVRAWRVTGERPVESRFDAARSEGELSPLVGREPELALLVERWRLARDGKGRVVTLIGEPGIGKSRLSQALRDSLAAEPRVLLRYHCSARFQNTALYPVIRQMQQAARLAPDDTAELKLDKLEVLLLRSTPPDALAQTLPYLAALLSVPTGDRYAPVSDTPERQKERTLSALKAQIAGLTREAPVLMMFEDLHWVDPSTLELIDQFVREISGIPVFLLATARAEFSPPWAGLPHAFAITLDRLGRQTSAAIAAQRTHGKALPKAVLDQILEKSDGIPLFVEELTKTVIESGMLEEHGDSYTMTAAAPALSVPSTLHDSLMERLDRLSVVKEVAQVGAAIGRDFSYELLAAVLPLAPAELDAALARLIDADLVHCRGRPPQAIYSFKHALINDAAYASMLRARRQSLHARIAEVLETHFPHTAQIEPEVLAHHLTEAGMLLRAVPYWQLAGQLANARVAPTEACRHFTTALDLLARLPPDTGRNPLELGLRVQLGLSLSASRGYAAPEVEATYKRARELCQLIGDTPELYAVLRGLCTFYIVRDDLPTAHELAQHCVRLGEETGRADFLIEGHTALGYTLAGMGDLQDSQAQLLRALEIYRTNDGSHLTYPSPQDPAVACLCLLSTVTWMLGNVQRAIDYSQEAIAAASALKRPFDLAYAHCYVAMFENLRRNPQSAAEHASTTIQLSQQHGFAVWLGAGTLHSAIANAALGQADQAVPVLSATLAAWQAAGAEANSCFFLAGLANAQRAAGRPGDALSTVEHGIQHAERHQEHFYDAALYRIRGELRAASTDADATAAEEDIRHAIDIARRQGARSFELRATVSLHALCLAHGKPERSRTLLETIYEDFAQTGVDSADLQDARKLLQRS